MKHSVPYYAVYMPLTCFYDINSIPGRIVAQFIDFDTIMANLFVRALKGRNGILFEYDTQTFWFWSVENYQQYQGAYFFPKIANTTLSFIIEKTALFIFSFLAFGFVSLACTLVTRIGLMASSVGLLFFCKIIRVNI